MRIHMDASAGQRYNAMGFCCCEAKRAAAVFCRSFPTQAHSVTYTVRSVHLSYIYRKVLHCAL